MTPLYFRAKFALYAFLCGAAIPMCTILFQDSLKSGSFLLKMIGGILFAVGPLLLGFLLKHHFQYQLNTFIEEAQRRREIRFPVMLMYLTVFAVAALGVFCLLFPEEFY